MSADRRTRPAWLAWSLLILALTLFPYEFTRESPAHEALEAHPGVFLNLLDNVLNVLLFIPWGAAVPITIRRPRRALLSVGATAAAFSISIELAQQFLPSRSSSFMDVATNTAGALIGYSLWNRVSSRVAGSRRLLRLDFTPRLQRGILLGCAAAILLASGILQYAAHPGNWDEDYPLILGNEHSGDRPWRGRVLSVDVWDKAMPDALVRRFAEGGAPDLGTGSLLSVNLVGAGSSMPPGPFRWLPSASAVSSPNGVLSEHAWLESTSPPRAIARRIRAARQFSVRLVCASADVSQEGPARVLSYSIDPMHRNFTIGQEAADMIIRLRTPGTGPNGSRVPLVLPGVFSTGVTRDILVTYGAATLSAAVAGNQVVHSVELDPGTILAGYYLHLPAPRHFVYFRVLYCSLAFALLLGLLALFSRDRRAFLAAGLVCTVVFSAANEAILALAAGRSFEAINFSVTLATGAVVLLIVAACLMGTNAGDRPTTVRASAP